MVQIRLPRLTAGTRPTAVSPAAKKRAEAAGHGGGEWSEHLPVGPDGARRAPAKAFRRGSRCRRQQPHLLAALHPRCAGADVGGRLGGHA